MDSNAIAARSRTGGNATPSSAPYAPCVVSAHFDCRPRAAGCATRADHLRHDPGHAQLQVEQVAVACRFHHAQAHVVHLPALRGEQRLVAQRDHAELAIHHEASARIVGEIEAGRLVRARRERAVDGGGRGRAPTIDLDRIKALRELIRQRRHARTVARYG
jgi:hypothetical protein